MPRYLVVFLWFCLAASPQRGAFAAGSCQQDPEYHYARQLFDTGAFADALVVYSAVLARDPRCMAAKIEMGIAYLQTGHYDLATSLLEEARQATFLDTAQPEGAAIARQLIDAHLASIPHLLSASPQAAETTAITSVLSSQPTVPDRHAAIAFGASDNINGGIELDELVLGNGNATFTQALSEESKAQHGTWVDLEAAWQKALPVLSERAGRVHIAASWRDIHGGNKSDLGTVRGVVEFNPVAGASTETENSRVVLSAGSFVLDGDVYRSDVALGLRVAQVVAGHSVHLGYQFADHHYHTVSATDGRYHRLSTTLPLLEGVGRYQADARLDIDYRWPESAERLGDYTEVAARLRLNMQPSARHSVALSYGVSQQTDADAYNTDFFGQAKRDIQQSVLDVGWALELDKQRSLEANLQHRQRHSAIKLFENQATDVTVGIRWELD